MRAYLTTILTLIIMAFAAMFEAAIAAVLLALWLWPVFIVGGLAATVFHTQ